MPLTMRQWEESLRQPAFCELLPVRDYLDNVMVRTNGSFVAGYEAVGLNTFVSFRQACVTEPTPD